MDGKDKGDSSDRKQVAHALMDARAPLDSGEIVADTSLVDAVATGPEFSENQVRGHMPASADDPELSSEHTEQFYESLAASLNEGFYLADIIYDQNGIPCDYRYREVNAAFVRLMGDMTREELIGMRYTDLQPNVSQEWLEVFRQVATTGNPVQRSYHAPGLRRHYDTIAYKPSKHQFAAVFLDVTARKRAEEKLMRTAERLEILSEIAARLLASDEPTNVVQSLCERVMEYLGCDMFMNFLVHDESGRLRLNASAGTGEAADIQWLDYGAEVSGCVASEAVPMLCEDIQNTLDVRTETARRWGIQAYACHPLLGRGGKVVGTLAFGSRTKTRFGEEELSLMKAVADQVAVAVDRKRLLESERNAAREIAEARAQSERRAAELESFFCSMSDGVVLHDAEGHAILLNEAARRMLGDPDFSLQGRVRQYGVRRLDGTPMKADETATGRALSGEIIRDLRYKLTAPDGKDRVISVSSSPVRGAGGEILGVTTVFHDVTDQAELERQREEVYKREHRIAETLQQALVPQTTYDIPGCRIACAYEPASEMQNAVGGDFYDVFDLGDGKIGLLIGDVAGKGLAAAIRVAETRHCIRSYAYLDPRPSKVLTLANDALCRSRRDLSAMATAFLAIVDTRVGVVTCANAGHEIPTIVRADGTIEELDVIGRVLGVAEDHFYREVPRTLQPGDVLLMFTDGITEARPSGCHLFGPNGLRRFLSEIKHPSSPSELVEGLLQAVRDHTGGPLRDDAAILAFELERLGR